MEQMRQWVLTVSLACITTGILQQFISAKKQISGIKLVLTLYILVTTLSPVVDSSLDWQMEEVSVVADTGSLDTQQEILSASEQNLSGQLEKELLAKGIQAEVEIQLKCSEAGEVEVGQLIVKTSADPDTVRSYIQALWETDVEVTCIS